jgi:NitT/TauT family transport system permease protein
MSAPVTRESEPALRPSAAGRRGRRFALNLAIFLLLLVLWHGSVKLLAIPSYILPLPEAVFRALWAGLAVPLDDRTGYYIPLWSTLSNAALGFVIGAAIGILLGSAMAEFRPVETALMPYAFALQSLPKVAIAPLIVIWFGFGDGSKVAMSALLTFFPVLVNTFTGIRATEPERVDLMRSLSASRLETYLIVKLPSAAPFIFAGLDMGIVYSLLGAIVAEFLGAQKGMGVVITQMQAVSDVAGVFAALVLLGVSGIALHVAMGALERRVVHWSNRAERET